MIDTRNSLYVYHDNGVSFSDLSNGLADYLRDSQSVTLSSSGHYIYVGYYKPFASCFVQFETPNINAGEFTLEYFNGTSWVALSLSDETLFWTRSGFMFWDKSSMESTTINSQLAYFVRLSASANMSATSIFGLNLVFCDDSRLKQEFYEIDNSSLFATGQTSHISAHVASRNHIIQTLRNLGYIKYNSVTGRESISQWDLHDIFEIREAACFLALSKIFMNLSDDPDDMWWKRYEEYQNKFQEAFKLALISIDSDDDGVKDAAEKLTVFKNWTFSR